MPEFSKDILKDIHSAEQFEWMEHNSLGSYAASTIIGMNTRREHGIVVVPYGNSGKKVVLLSKLEESVFIENRIYEISTNRYTDNIFPTGYHFLEKVEFLPFPRFVFNVEERIIHKTIFIQNDKNNIYIRYELKNQGKPIRMVIKPFISCRASDVLTGDIQGYNTDSYIGNNIVRWVPKPEMPELNVLFNKGEYTAATLWYHGFYYQQSEDRYHHNTEDLLNPGFFEVTLNPYESMDMLFSIDDLHNADINFEEAFRKERELRRQQKQKEKRTGPLQLSFAQELKSVVRENAPVPVATSIMENAPNMRNILLSLPGLLLSDKSYDRFKIIYKRIGELFRDGLLPSNWETEEQNRSYGTIDLSFWFIYVGYLYFKESNDKEYFSKGILEIFTDIFDSFHKGKVINKDKDELIICGNESAHSSLYPVQTKEGKQTRYGKLLEVNVLWYNALRMLAEISDHLGKRRFKSRLTKLADKVQKSFQEKFINKNSFAFYDFIDSRRKGDDFRMTQVIPLFLPFPIVDDDRFALKVLERIDKELLTPYGLRAASGQNETASKAADLSRQSIDFYSKAIWPWTVMCYIQADYNIRHDIDRTKKILVQFFEPLLKLREQGLLHFIPEDVFINDSVIEAGIRDFTTALAALKWSNYLINKWQKENKDGKKQNL
ncbi:MAG TPA: hypothetical protein EYP36_11840 [Calditrichaeota bacterium]|nr:hypothetical protein [Calditrichota bacterium]